MNQESIHPDIPCRTKKAKTGGELLALSALEYIESHYMERFSLQVMAGELFVNGSYLLRVFKKHTGFTPLAYHNHVRCEEAKKKLADSDECISEIGEAVGFISPAHFSHVFRKAVGCTPSEYRISCRTHREKADDMV